jgi:signal transduction histidine kinase/ligand-binding sensor domain-containing protein
MMCVRNIYISIAALTLGWSTMAWSLNPREGLSEYKHLVWRNGDQGLIGHGISVAQSTDGYLRVGTTAGLFRFDGVRFQEEEGVSNGLVNLYRSSDGSLWITGTNKGLMRIKDQKSESIDPRAKRSFVTEDEKGVIWYVRYDRQTGARTADLCSWVLGVGIKCRSSSFNLLAGFGTIRAFAGAIWIGSDTGLVRFQDGKFTELSIPGLASYSNQDGVTALLADGDDGLLVGLPSPGGGLLRLKDNKLTPVVIRGLNTGRLNVTSLYRDREGALWIGTTGDGIYRIYNERAENYAATVDSAGAIAQITEDQEGSIWFADSNGLEKFSDRRVVTVLNESQFHSPEVDGVSVTHDGTLWVTGLETLLTLAPGGDNFSAPAIIPRHALTTSILEDHAGVMWVGINNTLNRLKGGRFVPFNQHTGAPLGLIASLAEDRAFNLWAVSLGPPRQILKIDPDRLHVASVPNLPPASRVAADPAGGIYVAALNGDIVHVDDLGGQVAYPNPGGHSARIPQLSVMADGTLYASTGFGLETLRKAKIQVLDTRNGLPCNVIYDSIFDRYQNLWLYSQCGVVRIARDDFRRWLKAPTMVIPVQLLDAEDGASPYDPPFGGSARTPDGVLWFANEVNLQKVDPDSVARQGNPPPVQLEQFSADGKHYPADELINLSPLTGNIQIDYAGLSFVAPDKVRFRYKLDGFDKGWTDAGTRRQAFYTTLPPGKYRFHVIASDNNGVWNYAGASLAFVIPPAFTQTSWFLGLCVAGAAAVTWALVRLRIRQVRRRLEERMEDRVSERTRIARELHDSLLQGFQGLMFRLQAVRQLLPERPVDAVQFLDTAMQVGDQAIGEGRDAVQNLRSSSLGGSDLASSLSALGTEFEPGINSAARPDYRAVVEGRPRELNAVARDEAYRIVREAVCNAYQHAKARLIETEVNFGSADLTIRVRDDGIGMDPNVLARGLRPSHWGLPGMRERSKSFGGQLQIWSEENAGTEIELRIPARVAYAYSTASLVSPIRISLIPRLQQLLRRPRQRR